MKLQTQEVKVGREEDKNFEIVHPQKRTLWNYPNPPCTASRHTMTHSDPGGGSVLLLGVGILVVVAITLFALF